MAHSVHFNLVRWESKVIHSKAMEGFFRDHSHSPQFVLQLPQNYHPALQKSADSIVIPASKSVQSYTTADLTCNDGYTYERVDGSKFFRVKRDCQNWRSATIKSSSGTNTTFTLPAGISYPVQIPAGVTLQTASGHLYKVNVPVMVTQAPGGSRMFQQPIPQMFQQLSHSAGQSAAIQSSTVPVQRALQQQAESLHQPISGQDLDKHVMLGQSTQSDKTTSQSAIHQPILIQQPVVLNQVFIQQNERSKNHPNESVETPAISQQSEIQQESNVITSQSSGLHSVLQEPVATSPYPVVQQEESDGIEEVILLDDEGEKSITNEQTCPKQNASELLKMQLLTPEASNRTLNEDSHNDDQDIIQVDGIYDTSSDEEAVNEQDVNENEFLGIIDAEDLKALEEGISSSEDSASSNSEDEECQVEIVEEDPLNSGDDVSEQDVPDLFDTDNVIVCQYDKIHRSKNKWKFYLKDGVMCFGGKDYVFSKAVGEAEW
nr:PREDICTED: TFIIA-alpha and beta-like factor isoform X2 [Latimeria chalumnae]|eukprot:XP_014345875.1 PREDICTED: TFIIA-alpha and beta-like factor isoform X2 [Latimeria chalumnae]